MIKHFEAYTEEELYPDVFNDQLFRGVKIDKVKFIDDPRNRGKVNGFQYNDRQKMFANNYAKLGCENSLYSVHMYGKPSIWSKKESKYNYGSGNLFKVIPQKGAKFTIGIRNATMNIWMMPRIPGYLLNSFGTPVDNRESIDYQKEVIEKGIVFNLNYDEMIEWLKIPNEKNEVYHVWTESPCLLIKIKDLL